MNKLEGLGVALVTPFNKDLSIDFDGLTRLVEFNISNGVDYIVVLGTTAETATLSDEEKEAVKSHIIKINNGRVPLDLVYYNMVILKVLQKNQTYQHSLFFF